MCGICGYLIEDGMPISAGVLDAMTASLIHRGPDAVGAYRGFYKKDPRRYVALGHRRLSIIDLSSNADQPICNEDGTVWAVMNGEIYNFVELRSRLLASGHVLRSKSDSEVIVHLYEEKGPGFVDCIDGMFAIALWDSTAGTFLLARDRMGKKPLYWMKSGKAIVFGSEIKALLKFDGIRPEMNPDALPLLLALGYVPSPSTCHKGVEKVPPASTIIFSPDAAPHVRKYWDIDFETRTAPGKVASTGTALREKIDQAVRSRLVADRPLGAFLSGGIDSSIVVSRMKAVSSQTPHAFSIGFAGVPSADETPYAREVAKHLGIEHTVEMVQPTSVELISRLVDLYDEPFGDTSAIPTYLVCQMARQHVVVALSGDGGDELFAGYGFFPSIMATNRIPAWIARPGAALLASLFGTGPKGGIHRLQRVLSRATLPLPEQIAIAFSFGPWDLIQTVFPHIGEIVSAEVRRVISSASSPQKSPFAQISYVTMRMYLLDDLLVKADRMSMAHALEVRSPLLDTALAEWAAGLPWQEKLEGRTTKAILRHEFGKDLPASVMSRPKMGFSIPLDTWFRDSLKDYISSLLLSANAHINSLLPREWTASIINKHLRGERKLDIMIWILLALETWLGKIRGLTG